MGDNVKNESQETPANPPATQAQPATLAIEQIEAFAGNLKLGTAGVPGLGTVQIRELDADQAGRISAMAEGKQTANITPYIVCQCLYNGQGQRALRDADINRVKGWKSSVTKAIGEAVLELSGVSVNLTAEGIAEEQGN